MAHGKEIKQYDPKGWDEFVINMAGGLTIVKKTAGHWQHPTTGIKIREQMVIVQVACEPEQLNKILDFSLDYYKQDAIMAYEVSPNVIFKRR